MTKTRQIGAALMALVLVGSVLAVPVGTVAAQSSASVNQTAQTGTTVAPGDTVTVDVTVETTESGSPAIELEGVPADWEVQAIDNDGGTFQSTNYEWFWLGDSDLDGSYSHTVTYELTVPTDASAGDYTIDAVGSSQGSAGVDDDYEDTDPLTVTVEAPQQNQDPMASFTASPAAPAVGDTVTFDASASSDDGTIVSYEWDFDDGDTATGATPSHAYDSAGTYTVELTVTDDSGATDTTTQTVDVSQTATSDVSISQTAQTSTTVDPGDTVTVDVAIDTTASGAPAIELEDVPAGWEVQAIDNDGGTFQSTNYEWFWSGDSDLDGSYSHAITYELTVPTDASAGDYTIDAIGSSQGSAGVDDDYEDTDPLTVTVDAPVSPGSADLVITPGTGTEGSAYNNGAWQLENVGDQEITSIQFDLSTTAMPDIVFDPEGTAGDQGAKGLEIDDQTGDGVGVVSTADADVFSQPHNGVDGDDGYDVMTVEFTDFEPGEEFVFSVDNDPTIIKGATLPSQQSGPISGLEMSRGTVTVGYADGTTQTTQLFGDGSAGGAQATLDDSVASAPSIDVQDVSLDPTILDAYHSGATVSEADQTVTISGEPGATATLLHFEAERDLDHVPVYDGTPGYDVEPYEPSKVEQVNYQTVTLDGDGEATVDVTLLNSTEVGGYNYFVATHGQPGDDTGMNSDTVVLKLVDDVEPENQPPTASFSATPSDPVVGEQVSFDASDSADPDGQIASYAWDFGDGDSAAGATPTHAYDAPGTYTVTLTVTDDGGEIDTATQAVTVSEVPNDAPTAAFTVTPSEPAVDETVNFDAGDSTDPDGTIESSEWTIETAGGPGETSLLDTDFEGGSLSAAGWTHDAIEGSASAGVSDATSNSGSQSAFHNGGEGAIVSPSVDAADAQSVTIEYWAQKGAEEFSENPDPGEDEDLVVEYLNANGDWVEIGRIADSVAPGAEITESVTVTDGSALHDGLQVRFRQQGASVADGDYWHVDDVSVTAMTDAGTVTDTGETATHAFGQPGEYDVTLTVTDDDGATDTTTQTIDVQQVDQPDSIPEAVASLNPAGDDSVIGTQEIQQAIDLWVEDDPVPETDGETISTQQLQQLIGMWVQDETVDSTNGGGA